ncbi:nitroreductase [Campylobacter geochelonis]|nr:nitroreductase [Campylobacter geochelonis]
MGTEKIDEILRNKGEKMQSMKEIMQNRYSCRNFKDEKIADEVVREIINLTRLTPSSQALEAWKFVVVSGELLKELGSICNNQPQVSGCSHAVIILARTDLQSKDEYLTRIITSKKKDEQKTQKYIKNVALKTDLLSQAELKQYASLQCYMALANLVNIAESFDVKSCIIGAFDYEKLVKFVNLKEQFKPCIVVALGLSDDVPTPKIRQSLEDILVWKR